MIPPDIASSLQLLQPRTQTPIPNQATPAISQLSAILSNTAVGQQFTAVIQQQLPNGTYRAMVGQREITLALPFSAKSGDSLELEVIENNGKMALALLNNKNAQEGKQSVATTLSRTGQFINELLQKDSNQMTKALPLNNAKPILQNLPPTAPEIAQNLKTALTTSGMFYESHQARWVEGKIPTALLRQEPQAQQSAQNQSAANQAAAANQTSQTAHSQNTFLMANQQTQSHEHLLNIPREIAPIVQQQLDALATQQFLWQGQIWQGQEMQWEINEEGRNQKEVDTRQWHTRLKLQLPSLGNIDAQLRLNAQHQITLLIETPNNATAQTLALACDSLKSALSAAGLEVLNLNVQQSNHGKT